MSSNMLGKLSYALETLVTFVAGVRHLRYWLWTPFLVLFWWLSLIAGTSFADFGIHRLFVITVSLGNGLLLQHKVRICGRILPPGFEDAQILAQAEIAVFALLFEVECHSQSVNTIIADHRRQPIRFVNLKNIKFYL